EIPPFALIFSAESSILNSNPFCIRIGMQYDFKQRWTEGSGFMLDVVDQYCWETHRKVITPSETGVAALRTFGICSNTRAGQPLRTHIHSGCIEIVFL